MKLNLWKELKVPASLTPGRGRRRTRSSIWSRSASFWVAGLLCLGWSLGWADEEQDLIAILQSNANAPQKCTACQRLRVVGTSKAIPALASLLEQERTAQAARYALEGLPYPEAVTALRQAFGRTSGPTKAGLIDSLGWRHDVAAVPLLIPLLKGNDAMLASSAASALGRIGGKESITALTAARDSAPALSRSAVQRALLQAAEPLLATDPRAAAVIYRGLFDRKFPDNIRIAAWHGLVLADEGQRANLVSKALAGQDQTTQLAACKMLRELQDEKVLKACLAEWTTLPANSQLAVLDAQIKMGVKTLSALRMATQSSFVPVRVAAWQALGDLGDPSTIPLLAKVAASADPAERDAARDSLTRVHGPGVREGLLGYLAAATPEEKAELLRALGERADSAAANVLIQSAGSGPEPVRLAALESLRKLAVPTTVAPLLELAAKSNSDAECEPVLKAVYAACQASPDKEQTTHITLDIMNRSSGAQRRRLLPVLAELATPAALAAAQGATQGQDPEMVMQAVRVLSQWPNASPASGLLELARASQESTLQTLALRGAIEVAGQEPDASKRLALLQQAIAAAKRSEEKKQALGLIGQIPTSEALQVAMSLLGNPDLTNEAGLAAVTIAEKLAPGNPQLASETAVKVLAQCKTRDIVKRAWAIRGKPTGSGSFIQDWVVCGPFSKPGIAGAEAIFKIAFGPENAGEQVRWFAVPRGDGVNLAALFPGQENCAAYLKTQIIAPQECDAALLLGSDDGVKAWLNGVVVHSNNVDRPDVVDQDMAPIQLRQGTNDLMLKITQGGGGWSSHTRIVGADGLPIPGLQVACSTAPALPVAIPVPASAVTPKPAILPAKDAFKKIRLSDQFYAEGAWYGDFNRDGKVDVVAGPFWFEGPDFAKRHEYRPAKAFDPHEYSDNFLTYADDFNGDGWPDILCVPFPGKEGYWYENPAGKEGHWKQHLAYNNIGNESPIWGDVNGDGRSELIFCKDGYLGYAGPDPAKPEEPWVFHAISQQNNRYQRFTHGVGFGDINGDGRADIVEAVGWWEQPANAKPDQPWIFHPFRFAEAGAQMIVYDVDGDGLADIITAWHCHLYGLVWWQQIKTAGGEIDWKQHVIFSPSPDVTTTDFRPSQMHSMALADMNGDGLKDLVSGKRFWAHGPTGDKEPEAPAVLFWLELHRGAPGEVSFIPHLIDDDSGVGTQVCVTDLNGDGRPDVIVGNKKGIFVHLNQRGR